MAMGILHPDIWRRSGREYELLPSLIADLKQCDNFRLRPYFERGSTSKNPRAIPGAQPIYFSNVTVIDGDGTVLHEVNSFIDEGVIKFVDKRSFPVPTGTRIIDAQGNFLTPGIIGTSLRSDLLIL